MAQQFKLLPVTRSSHMGAVPLLIRPENAPGKTEDDGPSSCAPGTLLQTQAVFSSQLQPGLTSAVTGILGE